MSEVKRYDVNIVHEHSDDPEVSMSQSLKGEWIHYEDYAALQQKLDAVRAMEKLAELENFALYMADESVKAGNYPDGWQCKASNAAQEYAEACRVAMLRNIEEKSK